MSEMTLSNLLAWSVQVALLAVVAAAMMRLMNIDAPVVRYAWWRTVLLGVLLLPTLQPWQPLGMPPPDVALEAGGNALVDGTSPAGPSLAAAPASPQAPAPQWPAVLVLLLVTGAVMRMVWLGAGLIRLRRLRRAGMGADIPGAPDEFEALRMAGACVRFVPALRQPVTFGLRRPVVLLPESLRTLSPALQRAVLAHELWHVRRRDWIWTVGEEFLRAIFWFHPAISYLVSRVQDAREEVVDELSILSTAARRSYLEALLAFAGEPALYPAAPFIRRRQLFNRMLLISREAVMSSRRIVASTAAMAVVLVMTGSYGAAAFPLTAAEVPPALDAPDAVAQAQARDPRPGVPGPPTAREQELHTATAADPSNVTNWLQLAKLQEQRNAVGEAEATYGSAMIASNGSREVLSAMARFYGRTGQFDKAVSALEHAAASDPTDPSGHQLVATYYWEKAQKDQTLSPAEKLRYIERGIEATDRALALRSDYVEALTYKNILLRMQANLESDAFRRQQLLAEADALRGKAMELAKQRSAISGPIPPGAPAPPPPPPPPPPLSDYQIDGQQPVRVGGNIKTPTKIRDVKPVYPPDAQAAQISGMVIIEALIDTAGYVRSAKVLRSIPLLDQAAIDAVQQWQFVPTLLNGVPVPVLMTVTVNFTLSDGGERGR